MHIGIYFVDKEIAQHCNVSVTWTKTDKTSQILRGENMMVCSVLVTKYNISASGT